MTRGGVYGRNAYVGIVSHYSTMRLMLYALSDRRYREVAFFIVMAVMAGVANYVCMSELPDPHHSPWYWKVAFPVGIYFSTIFVVLFVYNHKE